MTRNIKKTTDQELSDVLCEIMSDENAQQELGDKLREANKRFDEREKNAIPSAELMMMRMTL